MQMLDHPSLPWCTVNAIDSNCLYCRSVSPKVQMSTMSPESGALEKVAWQKLTEELRTATLAIGVVSLLNELIMGIDNPRTAERRALIFLQEGGLPTLIRHLRGTAPSGAPNLVSRAITNKAAEALNSLLDQCEAAWKELGRTTNALPQLIDALQVAPTVMGRTTAAAMLLIYAHEQPTERRAMADAGVVGLLVNLYKDMWNWNPDVFDVLVAQGKTWDGVALVQALVCSEPAAANDLRTAICAPSTLQAFTALLVVQVLHPCPSN